MSEGMSSADRELESLRARLAQSDRINAVLMDRIERTVDSTGTAYAIFESNIVMQRLIRERTRELAVANETLRTEVEERRRAEEQMRRARDEAEAASAAKSQFLANMSHEIRTPLTAIIGFADLIAESPSDAAGIAGWASTIIRNAEHLLGVINGILDISRLESGHLGLEARPCDPVAVAREVCDLLAVRAEEKGIFLYIERRGAAPEDSPFRTDVLRLRQILTNLVGNAVKFTSTGGVVVRITTGAGPAPAVLVEVIDTGIGISAEAIGHVFDPFFQVDDGMSRSFGGTGLGLAIARRLAAAMGGSLSAESAPGCGSVFRLEVPSMSPASETAGAEAAQPERSEAQPQAGQDVRGLRVLLAEDGPDNRRLIGHHLSRLGISVSFAGDGEQAVAAVERAEVPFDAILMDMQMPRMDGYSAVSHLRGSGYSGHIIALTAHAMQGDRERCLEAGCDDYETKPVRRERLASALARVRRSA